MRKRLTKEQIEIIKDRYPSEGASLLSKEFGIQLGTIHAAARRMGLIVEDRWWSKENITILKDNYHLGASNVANILNMPVNKVVAMAARLRLGKKRRKWTEELNNLLINRYQIDGPKLIALELGMSRHAVVAQAQKLGITSKRKRWTREEDEFLKENFLTMPTEDLCEHLNKTEMSILKHAERLNLSRPEKHQIVHDDSQTIIEMYISGISPREIGEKYNVSQSCIRYVLSKNNINTKDYDIKRFPSKSYGRKEDRWHEGISYTTFSAIQRSSYSRSLEFNLTIEYLWDLFIQQDKKCALSGIDIEFAETTTRSYLITTASLDRIDSTKGYITGNVQWVHKDINMMKGTLSMELFINYCKEISKNMKGYN